MKMACMNMTTLARYFGNKLSDTERDHAEYHLSVCRDCRNEFASAFVLLKEDMAIPEKQPESLWRTIKQTITRIYEWIPFSAGEFESGLSMVCVRADNQIATHHIRFVKHMDDFTIHLSVEKTREDKANLEVIIKKDDQYMRNIRITLLKEDGGVVSRLLKESPEMFENLAFGEYELNMVRNSRNMGTLKFEINQTGLGER